MFFKRKDEKISYLCYGVELVGNIQFEGTLKIEGKIRGDIRSEGGKLIVSEGGRVEGNISVHTVELSGEVEGELCASRTIMLKPSVFRGNVSTDSIFIQEGSLFDGVCSMANNGRMKKGGILTMRKDEREESQFPIEQAEE